VIIEGAFLKLPELLLDPQYSRRPYETTINSYLAMALLLELNARNIPNPASRIQLERQYPPRRGFRSPGRADVFVDLQRLGEMFSPYYGSKGANWIETKFFGGIGRQRGRPPKVQNAARIALDIFRLCLCVPIDATEFSRNGRYLLVVLNRSPDKYLAFRREHGERQWLTGLFQQGTKWVRLPLAPEVPSFTKVFSKRLTGEPAKMKGEFRCLTRSFAPIGPTPEQEWLRYWGCLVQILDFKVTYAGQVLSCCDPHDKEGADLKKLAATQKAIASKLWRRDEEDD